MKNESLPLANPWRMCLLIATAGVIVAGMLTYSFRTGLRMSAMHSSHVHAAMEIKLQATIAHLWFEEIIAGDRNKDIEVVWESLELADWYAGTMLEGGKNQHGVFYPVNDVQLHQEIRTAQGILGDLRKITQQRLAERTGVAGTAIDQRHDTIYAGLFNHIHKVETRLLKIMADDLRRFRFTHVGLIVTCLSLSFSVGVIFLRFERRRMKDFLAVRDSNEDLKKEVAERRKVEAEREALVAELEVKNREMKRFTYTVSHDLRSPLITIRGFLGLLEKDTFAGNAERMKCDIKQIHVATVQMQRLLSELQGLSRIGRLTHSPQELSLDELVREAVKLVAGQISDRGMEVVISPDLPAVFGDRARLLEVFQNLIENAVKFTGNQSEPRVEIGSKQEGEETVCYVRDNGMGIDPRHHEKIFGLFDKLDAANEGTGIGLAHAKRTVQVHGGRIWVESEGEGRGCTFSFSLPQHRKKDS